MIFSIIAIALVSFLAFGFYQASKLTNIHIQKEVSINSAEEKVFGLVSKLSSFPKWSPFLELDPEQVYEVKGLDGQVGAQFHWNGNGGKDLGFQEIVKLEAPNYVGMKCAIQKPFKASPTFEYQFSKNAEGTKVVQDFKLESGIIDAFFMWLFGAKKDMAAMNQRGLELLKIASE